jgi:hypothetical protein
VTGKSSAGFWQRVIRNQANESSGLKHSSWPPTGGRSSAKNRPKRSQIFPHAFLGTAWRLRLGWPAVLGQQPQKQGQNPLISRPKIRSCKIPPKTALSRFKGGGRSGQKIHGGGLQETIFDSSGRNIGKSGALWEALGRGKLARNFYFDFLPELLATSARGARKCG